MYQLLSIKPPVKYKSYNDFAEPKSFFFYSGLKDYPVMG